MRNGLVVVQVALALVLIVSSGLMVRTFGALRTVDAGFTDAAEVQLARISLLRYSGGDQARIAAAEREILGKITAIPGRVASTDRDGSQIRPSRRSRSGRRARLRD